jgi:hypothetical protein
MGVQRGEIIWISVTRYRSYVLQRVRVNMAENGHKKMRNGNISKMSKSGKLFS